MQLTESNFAKGFLVDDEVIGGVTQMGENGEPVFAAYVSQFQTGETLEYREFPRVELALAFLNSLSRPWTYEAVGCGTHPKSPNKSVDTGCGSGACSGCS